MYHADSGTDAGAASEYPRVGVPVELSIVIVSYNTRSHLEECLEALGESPHAVTVVDNASTDGSPDLVRDGFPRVKLMAHDRNLGYGAAANTGMAVSPAAFYLILNPDVTPEPGAIDCLLAFGRKRVDVGIAGPRLLSPDRSPQQSLAGYPTEWWTGRQPLSSAPSSELRRSLARARRPLDRLNRLRGGFLVGAALLIRAEALEAVGGFDPRFFLFGEEVDLCLRMQQAGWKVELCPDASFVHVGGAATSQSWTALYREHLRSHLRFLIKHRGSRSAERARRVLLWSTRARGLLSRGEPRSASREAAAWLASANAASLVDDHP